MRYIQPWVHVDFQTKDTGVELHFSGFFFSESVVGLLKNRVRYMIDL